MKTPPYPVPSDIEEAPDPESACQLLREVCCLANTAIRVSRERPNLVEDGDDDDRQERIRLLRQTLAHIGWVADVALRKLGESGVFATAEDWMLAEV